MSPYPWQITDFEKPPTEKLVIYELLIRDFLETHDYKTLRDTIQYLKRLGVNVIELMPVMEFSGNNSWGYNPIYHLAADKYYGPAYDFKSFVDSAHANGIAVIMDMVLNQCDNLSPLAMLYWDKASNRPAVNNPWLNQSAPHPFSVFNDFNHESSATKYFVDRVNRYWVEEFKIDGYSFDLSKGFTQTNSGGNVGLWGQFDQSRIDILTRMADSIWAFDSSTIVILEHFAENSEETVFSDAGNLLWNNLNYDYNEATMGYSSNLSGTSYLSRGWDVPHLISYMESHDEERLMFKNLQYGNSSGNYDIQNFPIAIQRIKLAAAFYFTIPGVKMIWQFGELGYDFSINYPCMTNNCRTDPKPIRWDYFEDGNRRNLYKVFQALINLKKDYSVFQGEKDQFRLVKNWAANVKFEAGHRVKHKTLIYESALKHTSSSANEPDTSGGLSVWLLRTFSPTVDYSPQTKDKAVDWLTFMAGWRHAETSGSTKCAILDHNCIIKGDTNGKHRRTIVDGVYTDPVALPIEFKKVVGVTRVPIDGAKILVAGTGTGLFSVTDPNGKDFDNAIAKFIDPLGTGSFGHWEVWRTAQDDDEIIDREFGDSWTYQPCNNIALDGTCAGSRQTGWVKGSYTASLDLFGVVATVGFTANGDFDCIHPIKRNSGTGVIEFGNEKLVADDTSGTSAIFVNFAPLSDDRQKFFGLNFGWPAARHGITTSTWGSATIGEQITLTKLDFKNMHQTHTGARNWFGEEVEDYFPIRGFAFFELLEEFFIIGQKKTEGNYKVRIWLVDENDNMIELPYSHGKNGVTSPQNIPIGKAKTFRSLPGVSSFIRAKEPEILDVFDWEKVVFGGIESVDSFDGDGRNFSLITGVLKGRFIFSEKI
ncbi:MAG: hypothetical protein IIA49_06170, partial [Bacteroidetes bacterium]|nr:hypothetical protein [Bacteroidota bacterium]